MFEEVEKKLPCLGLQIAHEKIQWRFINIRPLKVQIRRDKLLTLNDFHGLLGDISCLHTIGVKDDELANLFKTLDHDKDLNSPRELSTEGERELSLVEKKL